MWRPIRESAWRFELGSRVMVDLKRWARIEELFHQALERSADTRASFVEEASGDDADLRDRVLGMLAAESDSGDFLEHPVARVAGFDIEADSPRMIGAYRVVRPLGAGGMGEVFLAVDEAEDIHRYVAVKVLPAGSGDAFDSRFSSERAILAQLEHPGIARFISAGTTDDERPYYVMEYVEGERIDEYADRRSLRVPERVRLLRDVCRAVEHAHANLVVHRDLKPANILVTEDGTVKLLDFGIAKLIEGRELERTRTEDVVATPEYAAPEQLRGDPTTTATDVYSLGVLLYESVSGHRPFTRDRARARAFEEVPTDPIRPSVVVTRLGQRRHRDGEEETITPESVSGTRRTVPSGLRRVLQGDLDNIVLKAMQPGSDRRYPSAAALADDLDRYLEGRPVWARGRSTPYRIGKFVRRNRLATSVAAVLALTVLVAVWVTLEQNRQIRAQATTLGLERDRAVAVQGFLLESFGAAGDAGVAGDSVTVRQLLDRQAATLDETWADGPADALTVEMVHVVAEGYERIGAFEEAERWAERAVAERVRTDDRSAMRDRARSIGLLGWIHHERSDFERAETHLREAESLWRTLATDSTGLARALNDLGAVLSTRGNEDAEQVLREALSIRQAVLAPSDRAIAVTANNLGNVIGQSGRPEEAVEWLDLAKTTLEASLGPEHPRTLLARMNVAAMRGQLGEHERWADDAGEIVEVNERLGRRDVQAGRAWESYGRALGFLGRFDESEEAVLEALSIFGQSGDDQLVTGRALYFLGTLKNAAGDRSAALGYARDAVSTLASVFPDGHAELAEAWRVRGALAGERAEQIESYRSSAEMWVELEGASDPRAVRSTLSWARASLAAGDFADALVRFDELVETVPAAYGPDHAYAPAPHLGRAEALAGLGEAAAARAALEEARERMVGSADVAPNRAWAERVQGALAGSN